MSCFRNKTYEIRNYKQKGLLNVAFFLLIRLKKGNHMKIRDLKAILESYDSNVPIYIELSMGTLYRLEKFQIKPSLHNANLTPIIKTEKDKLTNALILKVE